MSRLILYVVLATLPMVMLAAVTWRVVLPRWFTWCAVEDTERYVRLSKAMMGVVDRERAS